MSWSVRTAISVTLVARLGEEEVANETATAIDRIVPEALTNVARCAAAHRVNILLTLHNKSLVAVIENDGPGVAPPHDSGIRCMHDRVRLLDGVLRVESNGRFVDAIVVEAAVS